MTATTAWEPWALTYGAGVILAHTQTGDSVYFQPGDDSDIFLERFAAMQDAAPMRPIAAILAALWADYH